MKMTKRITAVFLAAFMLISAVPTTVFAATQNPYEQYVGEASFAVSTSFCATGETTKIFVDISKDSQMSAALFSLKYDTTLLEAVSVDIGLVLKNGYTSKNITKDGEVKVSYADIDPNYDEGRLFEVEFKAIGEIPEGKSFVEVPVELYVEDLRNYEDYKIQAHVDNGMITLIDTPYGDINNSGDITATDALMTLYSNSQLLELTAEQKVLADVNGDAKVSATDALLILQYSAGQISNYPIFTINAPSGLNVIEKDETFITLGWDEVKNTTGYNVYMDGNKVNTSLITDVTYTVDGLVQNSQHDFAVTAVNALKESVQSDAITVSTNRADRHVTFKDYDGTILNTQVVLSGDAAVEPSTPTRTGYTFIGWDKDTSAVYEDTEFVAQYRINTYTVTFDYQYNSQKATANAVYQTRVSKPNLISRTDYTLEGWYRDKNFVQKWDFDNDVVVNNMTLYAKWVTWSGWTTDTSLLNNSLYEVETKTQYSYSDKSTTNSTSSSLSGWTSNGSTTSYGSWSNYGWVKSKPTETDTLRITNTRTVTDSAAYTRYNFYRYVHWVDGLLYSSYGWYNNTSKYQSFSVTSLAGWSYQGIVGGKEQYTGTRMDYYGGTGSGNSIWYLSSTETVPAVTHTEWYYQTRTKTITYHYYKWSTYSSWSDTAYTASSTRQVKTRTVYRYKLKQQ